MSVSVCPIATIQVPASHVWRLLAEPSHYGQWWDAQTLSIEPPRPAHAGQHIRARSRAFGRDWLVHFAVERVDASKRQLDLTARLPLGITIYNHITCTPLDDETCRVAFG
jgi:hypothetical protein